MRSAFPAGCSETHQTTRIKWFAFSERILEGRSHEIFLWTFYNFPRLSRKFQAQIYTFDLVYVQSDAINMKGHGDSMALWILPKPIPEDASSDSQIQTNLFFIRFEAFLVSNG